MILILRRFKALFLFNCTNVPKYKDNCTNGKQTHKNNNLTHLQHGTI